MKVGLCTIKTALFFALSVAPVEAFSLLGPYASWMDQTLSYKQPGGAFTQGSAFAQPWAERFNPLGIAKGSIRFAACSAYERISGPWPRPGG
jgi:hypothetical protein